MFRRGRLLALLALLLVALGISLGACTGADEPAAPAPSPSPAPAEAPASPSPSPAPSPAPAPAVRGTPGCRQPLPADLKAGETVSRTLQSAGRTRTYLVYLPPAAGPAPSRCRSS
jgi:hypothetical protein